MHGEMAYMAWDIKKRLDTRQLVDDAKTMIVVLQNYFSPEKDKTAPLISKYAYVTDYHFVMKDKLKSLLNFTQAKINRFMVVRLLTS